MFSKDAKQDVKTPRICDVVWHDGEFIIGVMMGPRDVARSSLRLQHL